MKKIYFKGLNELRAIASLSVLLHHIELYKHRDGNKSLFDTFLEPFIYGLGKNAVYLFFVLSGFLITYLLIFEKEKFGAINIVKFYIRRVLRIWPLYYLIVLISFTLVPFLAEKIEIFQLENHYYERILSLQNHFYSTLILFLFFLPNVAMVLRSAVVGAAQSWSVGTEEQFYIIWPIFINKLKGQKILFFLLFIFIFFPAFKYFISFFDIKILNLIHLYLNLFVVELMALGGIAAYLFFYHQEKIKHYFSNHFIFIANNLIIISLLILNYNYLLLGISFAILILTTITKKEKSQIEIKTLTYLGKISYGIYMYHPFIMYICFAVINHIIIPDNILIYNTLVYFSIVSLTIIISSLSYNYFESYFLKLKEKGFTLIKSGSSSFQE